MSAATQNIRVVGHVRSTNRKRNPYRTRSQSSNVDETLFGSPSRFSAQKDTSRINSEDVAWDPPWVTTPRKTGSPLLWSPVDSKDGAVKNAKSVKAASPRRSTTPRNKYRLKKQSPTYVDETLFGTPRRTHKVSAPWATEDDAVPQKPLVTWSPPLETPIADISIDSKKIAKADIAVEDMRYTPVIKARPGSTLNTPQSNGRPNQEKRDFSRGNVAQKLDFCIENGANGGSTEHDPEVIIDRALKLAGVSRNTQPRYRSNSLDGLSSRVSTPGRYFWRRPASPSSTASRPSSGMSGQIPVKTLTKADDLFSATGTRVPLSARDGTRRPESARTAATEDSVPGLDLSKKPSRLHGVVRTPRSARSVNSVQSSIMNRPSWRP